MRFTYKPLLSSAYVGQYNPYIYNLTLITNDLGLGVSTLILVDIYVTVIVPI